MFTFSEFLLGIFSQLAALSHCTHVGLVIWSLVFVISGHMLCCGQGCLSYLPTSDPREPRNENCNVVLVSQRKNYSGFLYHFLLRPHPLWSPIPYIGPSSVNGKAKSTQKSDTMPWCSTLSPPGEWYWAGIMFCLYFHAYCSCQESRHISYFKKHSIEKCYIYICIFS